MCLMCRMIHIHIHTHVLHIQDQYDKNIYATRFWVEKWNKVNYTVSGHMSNQYTLFFQCKKKMEWYSDNPIFLDIV